MTPVSRKSEQADLERLASLYERAPDVEPDARLDRAVLGRARQTAPRSGWIGPWAYGLTGALCLVLVIGVGLRQGSQVSEAPVEAYEERASKSEQPESGPIFVPQGDSPVTEIVPESLPPAQSRRRAAAELSQAESTPLAADAAEVSEGQETAPDDWFDRARELLDQGHETQARQVLDAFRESHPDTDIPADLEEQLEGAARESEMP